MQAGPVAVPVGFRRDSPLESPRQATGVQAHCGNIFGLQLYPTMLLIFRFYHDY